MVSEKKDNKIVMPVEILEEMNCVLPEHMTMEKIQKILTGRKFQFVIYQNVQLEEHDIAELDLSVRAQNSLRRMGIFTIGALVEGFESDDDLRRIKNCGARSSTEIMGKLFFWQFSMLSKEQRKSYMEKILRVNGMMNANTM